MRALLALCVAVLTSAPFPTAAQTLLHDFVSPNEQGYGLFGSAVSGVEDVNGDDRGDVLVGAPSEQVGAEPEAAGHAYVLDGASGALLLALASPAPRELGYFGDAVTGVADVDVDGRGDLLVGAPGRAAG